MPQINDIRELAQQNARYVSNSPQDWMSYLDVAARLYRYSFTDALLIHAQRPNATACAELELWNQKMNRWVNRGAKGIALLDDTGPRTKLRYVFDIADTHLVRGGRTPLLWNLNSHEHEQAILDHLADTYGLSQTDSMNTALMELAQQLTADNLDEAMDGLAYEVADTFLEELDELNLEDMTTQGEQKLHRERDKMVRAYEHLKAEIATYENNMGFLSASSKKGNSILKEMERKIEGLKEECRLLEQKINLIEDKL